MAWDVLCGVAKPAWDVLSEWKSMWVVLSGVSKNGMGMFCPWMFCPTFDYFIYIILSKYKI